MISSLWNLDVLSCSIIYIVLIANTVWCFYSKNSLERWADYSLTHWLGVRAPSLSQLTLSSISNASIFRFLKIKSLICWLQRGSFEGSPLRISKKYFAPDSFWILQYIDLFPYKSNGSPATVIKNSCHEQSKLSHLLPPTPEYSLRSSGCALPCLATLSFSLGSGPRPLPRYIFIDKDRVRLWAINGA